jgi:N-acyl-D-aspartate/D-glutamate deacylase
MPRAFVSVLALACAALAIPGRADAQQRGDVAIVGGRVMDPTSGVDRVANVLIRGDRIVAITDGPVGADRVIDASGLVVAPGFVDILAGIPASREPQRYKIKDGVTTVIGMHGGPVDIEGWYRAFEAEGSLVNYGTAVGHSSVRQAAGATDRYAPATEAQLARMREIAGAAIEAGALGVGFGINYVPGASYEEVIAMFDVAARHGVPAHVHSRYKGSVFPQTIVQSLQEVITAAAVTGASAQIVHLASSGVGSMATSLAMIEGARRHGIDIMADIYPYLANSTRLESALYDPGWQERFGGITYDSIMLVETGERLNEETFRYWRERGATIITFFIPKDEMVMALKHPDVMVASDGVIVGGKGHPRGAGTFARVVGRFVREEGYLPLMEALRKVTIMPAERLEEAAPSMRLRGRLGPGAYADITVFDPDRLIDRATYREPARYSAGVEYVLVNGVLILDRGEFVEGAAPGRPIRRGE